jgi:hypothetical protein
MTAARPRLLSLYTIVHPRASILRLLFLVKTIGFEYNTLYTIYIVVEAFLPTTTLVQLSSLALSSPTSRGFLLVCFLPPD